MGALTVSIKRRYGAVGPGTEIIADITGSSSYATGGEAYTNPQFELILGADAIGA